MNEKFLVFLRIIQHYRTILLHMHFSLYIYLEHFPFPQLSNLMIICFSYPPPSQRAEPFPQYFSTVGVSGKSANYPDYEISSQSKQLCRKLQFLCSFKLLFMILYDALGLQFSLPLKKKNLCRNSHLKRQTYKNNQPN